MTPKYLYLFLTKLSKEKGEVWLSDFLKQVKKKNCYKNNSDCRNTLPVQDNQTPVSIEPLPTHHGPEEPFQKEIKPCIRWSTDYFCNVAATAGEQKF